MKFRRIFPPKGGWQAPSLAEAVFENVLQFFIFFNKFNIQPKKQKKTNIYIYLCGQITDASFCCRVKYCLNGLQSHPLEKSTLCTDIRRAFRTLHFLHKSVITVTGKHTGVPCYFSPYCLLSACIVSTSRRLRQQICIEIPQEKDGVC